MVIIDMDQVRGHITPPPFVRELKLFASPLLQDEADGISLGMSVLQPGTKSSSHIHDTETETWVVMEGAGRVVIDGGQADVKKNTIIIVPPGQAHQLVNDGLEVFKVLWIYTPPGPEKAVLNQAHY